MSKLGAKLPTGRLVHWTDLQGMSEWERLQTELATLETSGIQDNRETGSPKRELAQRITDLEQAMDASGITFELSAISAKRWIELRTENTHDDLNADGEMSDADYMAFINAVITEPGVILSVAHVADGSSIDFDGPEDWPGEVETMTLAQWGRFAEKVKELNAARYGAPKSQLASLVMRPSDKS